VINAKVFYDSGELKSELVGGTHKGYYEDGTVKIEMGLNNDRKIKGYYENGTVKFVMDLKNIDFTQYDEFGNASPMDETYIKEVNEELIIDMDMN